MGGRSAAAYFGATEVSPGRPHHRDEDRHIAGLVADPRRAVRGRATIYRMTALLHDLPSAGGLAAGIAIGLSRIAADADRLFELPAILSLGVRRAKR
jgi:hypothetical protein